MDGFMKHKIMQSLVILEKCLNLNDRFQKWSIQKKIFSQRMINDIIQHESPTLNYCMMLMSRGPNVFALFIDTLIEIKQNVIVDILLNTTLEIQ